jgi:RimJ/RimL family protein N-acetyltransferase
MRNLRIRPRIRVMAGHRIDTDRLILRPPLPADAGEISRLLGTWQVAHWLVRVPYPYRPEHAAAWVDRSAQERAAGTGWPFVIDLRATGTLAGSMDILVEAGRGTLGYWLAEGLWGRGYATEAASAMVEFAFDILRLDTVDAHALRGNVRSMRVLEKAGLSHVDRRHEDTVERGRVEVEYFALSRSAWLRKS